jgi:ATP-dependent DNA helicase RecG
MPQDQAAPLSTVIAQVKPEEQPKSQETVVPSETPAPERPQAQRPPDRPPKQRQPQHPPGRKPAQREEGDAEDEGAEGPEVSNLDDFIDEPTARRGRGKGGSKLTAGTLDIPPQPRLARPPRKPRPPLDPEAAADILHGLNKPVTTVKGVGPHMATLLGKLGVETVNDLLFFLPRRYDDYTRLTYISRLQPNQVVTIIGTVRSATLRVSKTNRKDFAITLDDGTGVLTVIFFGQHWLVRQIRVGHQLVLSGETSIFTGKIQMTNPEWEHLDTENLHTTGIVPVYPLTKGLSARTLRRLMKNVINYWAERVVDYVPESVLERSGLGDLGWALKNLHFPEGQDHLQHAKNRYIFDELLTLQLAILANRREWQSVPAQPLNVTDEFLERFIETVFPYLLTSAQRRAIDDIRRDVATPVPMNRLLQGDVGAGKTAVATVALGVAFGCGKQSAIMAPTSILAEQHYRNISQTLERMPPELMPEGRPRPVVGLLTSALTNTEREAIYRGLADGSIDIIIGTHALIQEGVEFHDLAVAVIDEQHRFGVEQRGRLRGKGTNPHVLIMTATPIPRTLALTLYADLDLSIIDEKPPGRQPVQTRVVPPTSRERVMHFVEAQLEKGRQAFVVHPLVEASEKIEAASAVEAYEDLQRVFYRHRVGLLHGRMKPTEKDEVMATFSSGGFDVLVTTSVAEVGVDVPNASVMVIESANRFGLAQLHQFRGRVGRGEHKSYCILIADTDAEDAQERLRAMESTNDGFRLAEIDWKLRGAGDLVGTRQSGAHKLQLMAGMTPELVELAQREAHTLYAEDPDLSKPEHRLLAQRVVMLHNEGSDLS